MSDDSDPDTGAAMVARLDAGTAELDRTASQAAQAMTQAVAPSALSGARLAAALTSLARTMASVAPKVSAPVPGATVSASIARLTAGLAGGVASAAPAVRAFADGGVIGTPSYFPLGAGLGLAGEAGPEAIMPLRRAADGSLGVAAPGGGGNTIHVQIATPDVESFRRSESYVTGQLARAVARGQRSL
jgi:phage-related minor tail protein